MNFVPGTLARAAFKSGGIAAGHLLARVAERGRCWGFRPEDCRVVAAARPDYLAGTIYSIELMGDHVLVTCQIAGASLVIKAEKSFTGEIGAPIGIEVPAARPTCSIGNWGNVCGPPRKGRHRVVGSRRSEGRAARRRPAACQGPATAREATAAGPVRTGRTPGPRRELRSGVEYRRQRPGRMRHRPSAIFCHVGRCRGRLHRAGQGRGSCGRLGANGIQGKSTS